MRWVVRVPQVRRLFANAGSEMGDVVKQSSGDKPGAGRRRVRNGLMEPPR